MAYSVVQHNIGTITATPTTALTWGSAPTAANLLLAVVFHNDATSTVESSGTVQGWGKIIATTDGVVMLEVWYRIAHASEGTTGPSFNNGLNSTSVVVQAEIAGWTGTPVPDLNGTASGSGVASLLTTASGATIDTGEFVFGVCGDNQGAASPTWNASTASGSATFGADIDTLNPATNSLGIRDAWATSGISGTSPSLTFNLSISTLTKLLGVIVTFRNVTTPMWSKFYLHDSSSTNTGTLPGATNLSGLGVDATATGASTNRDMSTTVGSSQIQVGPLATGATFGRNWWRRFLSGPLAAQWVPGQRWTFAAAAKVTTGTTNPDYDCGISLWRPSTGLLVSILAQSGNGSLWTASEAGSVGVLDGTSGDGVAAKDGDILVLEVFNDNAAATGGTLFTYYDGTTDPVDGVGIASAASYLSLSTPIAKQAVSLVLTVTDVLAQFNENLPPQILAAKNSFQL